MKVHKKKEKNNIIKFFGTVCPYCGSNDIGVVYKPQYIREVDYSFCYDCGAVLRVDGEQNVISQQIAKEAQEEICV